MTNAYTKTDQVFDFSQPELSVDDGRGPVCTYSVFESSSNSASAEHPLLVLEDPEHTLPHHQNGSFRNPKISRTAFEYEKDGRTRRADILRIDKRFLNLWNWLGEHRFAVRLSGLACEDGYAVYKIRTIDLVGGRNEPDSHNDFVQLVTERLLESEPPQEETEEEEDVEAENIKMTDLGTMEDYLECAGSSLPAGLARWARRQIHLIKSGTISPDERRHALRALSIVLNIKWQGSYFESIDPVAARKILDEELYGLETVKQRIIETIIQINRTHTLPAYGLLLIGPAGTGKSQLAYAVARILQLPWTSLDMSAIRDGEALTGSSRIYANAKPGLIMDAFTLAGASNLVFIINELDKADNGITGSNPADALLTLLDNLGYMDNYIECRIPTAGVYPIATANEKERISDPLMTRFSVIEIPDYTDEEKKVIFSRYAMPRVLHRMGMHKEECTLTDAAVGAVVELYRDTPGCRDLEQAAEHLAAHALYRIETEHLDHVVFDARETAQILSK